MDGASDSLFVICFPLGNVFLFVSGAVAFVARLINHCGAGVNDCSPGSLPASHWYTLPDMWLDGGATT